MVNGFNISRSLSPNAERIAGSASAKLSSSAAPLRYPQKSIGKNDDYLEIGVIEYVPPGLETGVNNLKLATGTEKNSKQKARQTIQLPIPSNIGDTNQVNWGDDSLNPLAAAGVEAAGSILKSKGFGEGTIDAIKNLGTTGMQVLTQGGGQDLVINAFSSALVNSVSNGSVNPTALLSRSSGQVLNPNLELLFSGVNLRTFQFDFDFAPRDEKESNVVKEIIRIFKQSMAPKTGSNTEGAGLFISAPNIFLLKYKSGSQDHPYLNKFKPCALTSMGMNYTGSGSYATYADKTPVHMKLSLSFTELNPIYNEDYNSSIGQQAVGY
jgi:hypothetical protein